MTIRADEDDLCWKFDCKNGDTEVVDICSSYLDDEKYMVFLSNDEFDIEDVPNLILALQAAYDFHNEHKENT
jgi:hypothetical protein